MSKGYEDARVDTVWRASLLKAVERLPAVWHGVAERGIAGLKLLLDYLRRTTPADADLVDIEAFFVEVCKEMLSSYERPWTWTVRDTLKLAYRSPILDDLATRHKAGHWPWMDESGEYRRYLLHPAYIRYAAGNSLQHQLISFKDYKEFHATFFVNRSHEISTLLAGIGQSRDSFEALSEARRRKIFFDVTSRAGLVKIDPQAGRSFPFYVFDAPTGSEEIFVHLAVSKGKFRPRGPGGAEISFMSKKLGKIITIADPVLLFPGITNYSIRNFTMSEKLMYIFALSTCTSMFSAFVHNHI